MNNQQPLIAEHRGGPIRVLLWDVKARTTLQCDVLLCDVLLWGVKSHTTLQCDVLLCDVKSNIFECDVLLCDVLLWDVRSHTTLQCDVLLCDVKSHATLQPFNVMYCYVM